MLKKFKVTMLSLGLAVAMFASVPTTAKADDQSVAFESSTSMKEHRVIIGDDGVQTKADVEVSARSEEKIYILDSLGKKVAVKEWYSKNEKILKVVKQNKYSCVVRGKMAGRTTLVAKLSNNVKYNIPVVIIDNVLIPETEKLVQQGKKVYTCLYQEASIFSSGFSIKSADKNIARARIDADNSVFGYMLEIKGVKPGKTKIYVKDQQTGHKFTIDVTVKKKVNYRKVEDNKKAVRRAYVVGQEYKNSVNELISCPLDGQAMKKVLKETGYSKVKYVQDVNKEKFFAEMKKAYKGATEDDISLFYYSGHGGDDGSLCGFDSYTYNIEFISPDELAEALSKVPGKVIVILDCCFSGKYTVKSANDMSAQVNAAAYNQMVINAFKAQDKEISRNGFRTSKFQILTACSSTQYSYCNEDFGFFTKTLFDGIGYNYGTNKKTKIAYADVNGDNKLTLEECYDFTSVFGYACGQNATCYPAHSGFKIFERK